MSTLSISAYRASNHPGRHGFSAAFNITKKPKAYTIVQNISVVMRVVNSAGKRDNYENKYSELWEYPARDRLKKKRDHFLIPLEWRKDHEGFYKAEAVAYLVEETPPGYDKGKLGDEPWGDILGSWTIFKPAADKILGGLRRSVHIKWDNTTSQKGKDLNIMSTESGPL